MAACWTTAARTGKTVGDSCVAPDLGGVHLRRVSEVWGDMADMPRLVVPGTEERDGWPRGSCRDMDFFRAGREDRIAGVGSTWPSTLKIVDAGRQIALLTRASTDLDQRAVTVMVSQVLQRHGVVAALTQVLAPALCSWGEVSERTADGVNAERMLSECTRAALAAVSWQPRRWLRLRPVLLGAPDGEQRVLELYAVAAALAEAGRPSVQLGASVPPQALLEAVTRLKPGVVFLWSQARATARRPDLGPAGSSGRGRLPVLVLGGPGWSAGADEHVGDLARALDVCAAPATSGPARHRDGSRR